MKSVDWKRILLPNNTTQKRLEEKEKSVCFFFKLLAIIVLLLFVDGAEHQSQYSNIIHSHLAIATVV